MSPAPSPNVSALVTAFNHERFIEAAIESLLGQTYPNIEIIIVDDGSADRTVELASDYSSKGVRLLHGGGAGPSRAMNLAMSHASGDIFLLQSGDDLSAPTRAATQVQVLATAEIAACFPNLIDGAGAPLPREAFTDFYRMHSVPAMETLFGSLYQDGNFLCASSVAMRRSVWEAIGGFHVGLLQLQDYEYWMRALIHGYEIRIDPDPLASYRLHGKNLSDSRHANRIQRELATLLRGLAPLIPERLLLAVLYGRSFEGIAWRPEERRMLEALFFLRHPAELVRQIGIDALISVMDDPQFDSIAGERFRVSHKDLFAAILHR